QLDSAGHHHETPGRAGQQRAHLTGIARIVQDNQYPQVSQDAAVERTLRVKVYRNSLRRHGEGIQEASHRIGRVHRCSGPIEAAQVNVQLTIRESVANLVAPVNGERRLAYPGRTGDSCDSDGPGGVSAITWQ